MAKLLIVTATLVLIALATGCDPHFVLRGQVVEDGEPARPIDDATVSLFCPKDGEMRQFYPSFSTDAQGRFEHRDAGLLRLDCELRAQKDGFQLVDLPLGGACKERRAEGGCARAEFEIELLPVKTLQ